MTSIITSWITGDKPAASWFNAIGKALAGMGAGDDNDAKPILPLSFDLPVPVLLGASAEETKAVASGSYTVPSGKLFIVENYMHTGGQTDSVTPAGASAITLSAAATTNFGKRIQLILGVGDAITMGTGSRCSGLLLTLPAFPNAPTRILQAGPYTTPASKRTLIGHVSTWTSGIQAITVDAVNAAYAPDPGDTAYDYVPLPRYVLKAAQVLAGTDILISGLQYSV